MNSTDKGPLQGARFAVRFSPAIGSPWWALGSRWLGCCAFTRQTFTHPVIEHIPNSLHERLIADPRRHRASGLNAKEDALLLRWRHPFVLDAFCFHLPLTGSLRGVAPAHVETLRKAAQRAIEGLPACAFDAISLFVEPAPGEDFIFLSKFGLVNNLAVI